MAFLRQACPRLSRVLPDHSPSAAAGQTFPRVSRLPALPFRNRRGYGFGSSTTTTDVSSMPALTQDQKLEGVRALFSPRNIAIVGASDRPGNWSMRVYQT